MNRFANYRSDIDGLRALAVLGVLLFHIDAGVLGGGFVGVDVFFVISGFLITAHMARDLDAGKFSIARFYERRIRRIFPALFCVIVACVVAAWFILLPEDLENFAKSVKYVAISLPNLFFLKEIVDYFGAEVSELPMLHTWSLGVEEQFYFVFPLLLMVLYRFVRRRPVRLAVVVLLSVASLVASIIAVRFHPERAFFLLLYRGWELMLGSILALAKPSAVGERWNHAGGVIGLGMILAAMVTYTERTAFPGLGALLPCVGSGLLIHTGSDSRSIAARVLSWRPLVFIGLISYSVYLWHWPLLVFVKYRGALDHPASAAMVFAGSLVAGALSWRFIEQPFRKSGFGTRRMVFGVWFACCVLLVVFWHAARKTDGFAARYPQDVLRVLAFKQWATKYRNNADKNFRPEEAPVYGAPGVAPDIAIWGDSHARALLPVLDVLAKKHARGIRHFGMNGVPPVVGATPVTVKNPGKISDYTARTLDLLTSDASITTVVLISKWDLAHDPLQGGGSGRALLFHERSFDSTGEMDAYYASKIQETANRLLKAGKRVVIIEPIPAAPFNVPDEFAKTLASGGQPEVSVAVPDYGGQHRTVLSAFDALEPSDRLIRLKPQDRLVSSGRLLLWVDGKPLYADRYHLSEAGAFEIEELLSELFMR